MTEEKKPAPSPFRANKGQAIFGWIAGVFSLLVAFIQSQAYDGSPLAPAVMGILLIMWALSYQKQQT